MKHTSKISLPLRNNSYRMVESLQELQFGRLDEQFEFIFNLNIHKLEQVINL